MIIYQATARVNPEIGSFKQGYANVSDEDGGMAMSIDFPGQEQIFVLVQSWDLGCEHILLEQVLAKRVKVTVEMIEDYQ